MEEVEVLDIVDDFTETLQRHSETGQDVMPFGGRTGGCGRLHDIKLLPLVEGQNGQV